LCLSFQAFVRHPRLQVWNIPISLAGSKELRMIHL